MVNVEADVVFGTGGGRALHIDVYRPDDLPSDATALVMWHGGGWRRGDRTVLGPLAELIAAEGFLCLSAEYRLNGESLWPAQIHDVKAAIRWTRGNAASLGIHPDRIAGLGSSAGAHLALMAAGTPGDPRFEGDGGNPGVSSALQAVIAIYPPTLLFAGDDRPSGGSPADALAPGAATPELAREASPIEYVGADFPPAFLLHGTADKVVPVTATLRLADALRGVRAPVETHVLHDIPHGFANFDSFRPLVAAEAANFLRRTLVDPALVAREAEARAAAAAAAG
jgi:acetyl esterase/lipase